MTDAVLKVLLIEDDPDETFLVMEYLGGARAPMPSFEPANAVTLEMGLDILSRGGVDAVLLDLMLPDSKGIDTFLAVRRRHPEVPAVVLTGLKDEALGLEAVRLGAQDYLLKESVNARLLQRALLYAVERARFVSRLKTLLDNAADAMLVVDAAGQVRYANPAAEALFGRAGGELVGMPFGYPVNPRRTLRLKVACGGVERTAELRATEMEWQGQPACLASVRDITEILRLEQLKAEIRERRRLDQLKDELVSSVSHQIRTPLTVIYGTMESLRCGDAGPLNETQARLAELAHGNVRRLLRVVQNLLELSRLESGRAAVSLARVRPAAVVRTAVQSFRLLYDGQKTLVEDLPQALPDVLADEDLLAQVLDNLLDNAFRFARSRVVVRARVAEAAALPRKASAAAGEGVAGARIPEPCGLQISVIDDGPGIPPESMGDLFNKFVQVARSPVTGYKGTGLGLAICKEMVDRQGGSIWAENAAGGGAAFHFVLPQHPA